MKKELTPHQIERQKKKRAYHARQIRVKQLVGLGIPRHQVKGRGKLIYG